MAAIKWGISGFGRISEDFIAAIKSFPEDAHIISAIATRSLDKSKVCAEKYGIETAYGCYEQLARDPDVGEYEQLARDPDVDVVYIGTINPTHYRLCLMMLHAGKHVICEKPICMTSSEAREVFELGKRNNLLVIEGAWTLHFPIFKMLHEEISADSIGDIMVLDVQFGINLCEKGRVLKRECKEGAVRSLGYYTIMYAVVLLGYQPEKIVATGTVIDGVERCVAISLHYSGGRLAHLLCNIDTSLHNSAYVYGTKGKIHVPLCWCPNKMTTPRGDYEIPLPKSAYPARLPNGIGLSYEIDAVRQSILKGETENATVPHSTSLAISDIIEKVMQQIGLE